MPTYKPLTTKCPLAKTPKTNPIYSKEVSLASGAKAQFADPTATRAMVALMDMQAVLGGAACHFGGPSAFAEIMSAAYGLAFEESKVKGAEWYECMHIINDAGHCENGIYALKANYGFADLNLESLKGFRSIHSPLTGHGESHIFPQGVYLSNGPLGSSLPQAQGLCFADGLLGKERVTMTTISDGACMEGEAKEAFAAIPGLAAKGKMAPFVLVVSNNNTKLSGRIDEDSFSMEPTFASLTALGWDVLELKEAHDLQACTKVLEAAIGQARTNPKVPIAIHARTIKGYGTKATAESKSGAHGFPLKSAKDLSSFVQEIYGSQAVPAEFESWSNELVAQESTKTSGGNGSDVPHEKVQVGVASALGEMKKKGFPVYSISCDLQGSTGVAGFHKEHPDSYIDIGVAESNMVSMAAGLSKEGFIPIVDTFSQFGVTKGALPFIMASLSEAPMIAFFSHVGFQDAADGASHQALSYFAMMSSIPHVEVINLTSSEEAHRLVTKAVEQFAKDRNEGKVPSTYVFFLGRENFPRRYMDEDYDYGLGEAQVIFDNSQKESKAVTIAASGACLHQAIQAAYDLEKQGVCSLVVNPSIINNPDVNTFRSCLRISEGRLITVEDHQLKCGMGAQLVHALCLSGQELKVKSLGVNGAFGQSAYKARELYEKHGLSSTSIVNAAMELL